MFVPDHDPLPARSDHPNFKAIVAACATSLAGDEEIDGEEIIALFDVAKTVAKRFDRLSDRVTVANGRVYFDGDEIDDSIATQIIRFLDDGVEDWKPLVAFMEKVASNPSDHSRTQLFDWLANLEGITLLPDGDILGYKGVRSDGDRGYQSTTAGTAIRNGEVITGYIPNAVNDVIEMPRSEVVHDPYNACSRGLHVGTFRYATMYARSGVMLKVAVNPRDVVSVPTDAGGEKIRVCRYRVLDIIDAPVTTAVDWTGFEDDEEEDDFYNPDFDL